MQICRDIYATGVKGVAHMQYRIPVCGELELDANSAVLVVGLSSGQLPLFCEVVGFCIPAFYIADMIISWQPRTASIWS